ncbi:class I SAM-dependent methyltransferase [Sphingobium phenoxybenzoativorans]|uniref:class I SAM-dependent methyltransferase n=1 Tax=Sphingobium phenoxybenzoativorans TaxID=1592790 RepID=UPI0009F71532|nr:class I SAM-dependent methyltransferase [Sphingobium phenoxybenzoativorans]
MQAQRNAQHFEIRETCPVCGQRGSDPFYTAPMAADPVRSFIASQYDEQQGRVDWGRLEGTDYSLVQCDVCALVYQRHVPNDALLTHIYSEMIAPRFLAELERERLTLDNFHKVAGELSVLFKATDKHPSDIRFLDYGFGYGRWARVARALGAQVAATELGDDKKRAAASIGVEMIDEGVIEAAGVSGERFDIVHTEQVFEHLVEPGEAFRRLAAATDGIMKVAVPRGGSIRRLLARRGLTRISPFQKARMGKAWRRDDFAFAAVQPLEHLNAYSGRTMQWLAQANGLKIIGRARESVTTVDHTSMRGFASSAARLGAKLGRRMLGGGDDGYYLFRKT